MLYEFNVVQFFLYECFINILQRDNSNSLRGLIFVFTKTQNVFYMYGNGNCTVRCLVQYVIYKVLAGLLSCKMETVKTYFPNHLT